MSGSAVTELGRDEDWRARTEFWPLFLIFLLFSAELTGAPGDDAETKRRKQEFLKSPVFKQNLERQRRENPPELKQRAFPRSSTPAVGSPSKVDKGKCGSDAYLKSYCFYPLGEDRWLICADKWGGCITKRDP